MSKQIQEHIASIFKQQRVLPQNTVQTLASIQYPHICSLTPSSLFSSLSPHPPSSWSPYTSITGFFFSCPLLHMFFFNSTTTFYSAWTHQWSTFISHSPIQIILFLKSTCFFLSSICTLKHPHCVFFVIPHPPNSASTHLSTPPRHASLFTPRLSSYTNYSWLLDFLHCKHRYMYVKKNFWTSITVCIDLSSCYTALLACSTCMDLHPD